MRATLAVALLGPITVLCLAQDVPRRIRVGGLVQQNMAVSRIAPVYPPLAKQARIQGVVRLEAQIGRDGRVVNLTVISGHPLLVQSALDAIKQWEYQPTILNGEAVETLTTIYVNFTPAEGFSSTPLAPGGVDRGEQALRVAP